MLIYFPFQLSVIGSSYWSSKDRSESFVYASGLMSILLSIGHVQANHIWLLHIILKLEGLICKVFK